ncbi:glycosyltransferase [Acidobacteria bacterium ACD]|nr:MAG: glycosyltransferase [Acidobacteriota bacterium]MCE7959345.1 glycosyltransferase [Acidobacteria bacterium ACB2]MDL1950244.1 glycosyltransferase [Acidobacteria bacterium ACD]
MNGTFVPRKVSVVVPVYNEEANLPRLLPRLLPALAGMGRPFEVVFVDDGSRDRSLEILREAAAENPGTVKAVELVRNAGQHMAIMAAFTATDGEYVVTLDADLQNPPEEIPKVVARMDEGHDVVATVRTNRKDTLFRRLASRLVNRTTALISGIRMNDYGCMLRGYHRDVVDVMTASEESSTFIPALAMQYARRPVEIPVAHEERAAGESKYSLYRLVRLNFDLMTGFSLVPLQLFALLGFLTSAFGVLFGVFLLVRRVFVGSEVEGVFTLFALAFVVLGVLMAGIGIVGEYVGRIYQQVRGRPRYLIRKVHGAAGAPGGRP